jgi:hypothetical protein
METRIVYYKGEGGGFPQVRAVMSLVCPGCPWLYLAPNVFQLCTNHLVLVLCRYVWVNKACHFFLVPSRSSITPLYPFIVLWAKKRAPTPCPSTVVNLGLTFESCKELGVHHLCFLKVLSPRVDGNKRFMLGCSRLVIHLIIMSYYLPFNTFSHESKCSCNIKISMDVVFMSWNNWSMRSLRSILLT